MALTYTPQIKEALSLPFFELPSVYGEVINSHVFDKTDIIVIMFICNHCPYVMAIEDRLIQLGKKYETSNQVQFIAICSNDASDYPEDSLDALKARADEKNYPFPYLWDESQNVARSFGAVCTPDLFVFDQKKELAYRGRLDDSWKDESKVQSRDLENAISNLLNNSPIAEQIPSMGCSIKWKSN